VTTGGTSATGGTTASGGMVGGGGSAASGGGTAAGGTAAGGRTAAGGAVGMGGSIAAGGNVAAGGAAGQGAGGTVGQGGTTGTGGATPTGGANGTGGASGAGGNAPADARPADAQVRDDAGPDGQATPDATNETGATSDAAGYQPCPTGGTACKILPLGDSITFGVGDEGNGGYRGPLFATVVAAQQKITFTGSLQNGPTTVSGQTFPQRNEGHSGWGISTVTQYSNGNAGIAILIPSPAFDAGSGGMPNIILLHIGTNDASTNDTATGNTMATRLDGLVSKITGAAPDALLVVAKIIPLWAATAVNTFNQAIPGLVQKYAGQGKHVVMVDMNTGFNSSTMFSSDNIHPNTTGYKFMADRWYAAIKDLLPK
jgi:lysophospholipase L1-like esterase